MTMDLDRILEVANKIKAKREERRALEAELAALERELTTLVAGDAAPLLSLPSAAGLGQQLAAQERQLAAAGEPKVTWDDGSPPIKGKRRHAGVEARRAQVLALAMKMGNLDIARELRLNATIVNNDIMRLKAEGKLPERPRLPKKPGAGVGEPTAEQIAADVADGKRCGRCLLDGHTMDGCDLNGRLVSGDRLPVDVL